MGIFGAGELHCETDADLDSERSHGARHKHSIRGSFWGSCSARTGKEVFLTCVAGFIARVRGGESMGAISCMSSFPTCRARFCDTSVFLHLCSVSELLAYSSLASIITSQHFPPSLPSTPPACTCDNQSPPATSFLSPSHAYSSPPHNNAPFPTQHA